jgi:hypothetical protein
MIEKRLLNQLKWPLPNIEIAAALAAPAARWRCETV